MIRDVIEQGRKKTGDAELDRDIATAFEGDPRKSERTSAKFESTLEAHQVP